jgi:glycosyltransferase involved in cell wall biosynthesis
MKVAVIGHSYLEPENQKNIQQLKSLVDIHCIVPDRGGVNIWENVSFQARPGSHDLFSSYKPFYISKSQYFLWTFTMGFHRFEPDIINIEYNPWSVQFIQAWLLRFLYCREALIVCYMKKNTFQKKPGALGFIKTWLSKHGQMLVDHVIAESGMVSELVKNKLNFPEDRISVTKQFGVDTGLFKPTPSSKRKNADSPFVVGYCGRFDAEKGVMDLIDAVRIVKNTVPTQVVLKLMGKSAYHDSLDDQLAALSKRINWLEILPPVPNDQVAAFLQGLDIFVLPSRIMKDHQEHDAHVLLEALATGIPCIGTASGIIPETIGDGTGLLVAPENPEELALAIRKLIQDRELHAHLSKRGREKTEREFSLTAIARKKFNIFKEIVDGHGKRASFEI